MPQPLSGLDDRPRPSILADWPILLVLGAVCFTVGMIVSLVLVIWLVVPPP